MGPRILEVRRDVLKKNDLLAHELRRRFHEAGVFVVSLVSSPGSGKTTLLERTLATLSTRRRVAAITGDLATEDDAIALRRSGARVEAITTGTVCHLDAEMVGRALAGWDLRALDLLFVENVGNLVCPASYDLGEDLRVVLVSVTEGENKPLKYPPIFHGADLVLVSKVDLADAAGFRRAVLLENLEAVQPGCEVIETSARTGGGMAEWIERLERMADAAHVVPSFEE